MTWQAQFTFGPNDPRTLEKVSLEYVSSHNSLMLQFVYTYALTCHIQMVFQPHMINTYDEYSDLANNCSHSFTYKILFTRALI